MTDPDIPKLIKALRKRLGLTQEQFAQRVGVTFSSVNHWENGKRTPQPFLVRRLVEMQEELELSAATRLPRISRRGQGLRRAGAEQKRSAKRKSSA